MRQPPPLAFHSFDGELHTSRESTSIQVSAAAPKAPRATKAIRSLRNIAICSLRVCCTFLYVPYLFLSNTSVCLDPTKKQKRKHSQTKNNDNTTAFRFPNSRHTVRNASQH